MDELLIFVFSWMLVLIATWGGRTIWKKGAWTGSSACVDFLNGGGYGEQSILQFEAEVNQIIAFHRESNTGLFDFLYDSCRLGKTAIGIQEPAVSPISLHSLSPRPRLPRRSYDEETWGHDRP
jgi:hypothetical protein